MSVGKAVTGLDGFYFCAEGLERCSDVFIGDSQCFADVGVDGCFAVIKRADRKFCRRNTRNQDFFSIQSSGTAELGVIHAVTDEGANKSEGISSGKVRDACFSQRFRNRGLSNLDRIVFLKGSSSQE